ncbi:MAG TPA: SDR family oxidoreductase [Bradyrhizobium sp.]|nr:SDR family oxidoreductase [Bradyrhizobium sp.]
MKDKTVVITGASSGIGLASARELARRGALVVMICRDAERAEAARKDVAAVAGGQSPAVFLADLLSQREIRRLAEAIDKSYARIDVLINNAGAVFARRELSVDGIEKTFAVNHLAPFLLTNLLLDNIRAAAAGRIVTVGSESYSSTLDFDNLQSEKKHHFLFAYFRSKLENILFTFELSRRLAGTGVSANCLSPGPTRTRFGSNMEGLPALFPMFIKNFPFFGSPEKGARTSVYLASAPDVAGVSGRFYMRCREVRTKPVTHDLEIARRLWSLSEALCQPSAKDFKSTQPSALSA